LSLFWILWEVIWCREMCLPLVMFQPVDCCLRQERRHGPILALSEGTVTETPKFRPGQRVAPGEQERLGRLLVIEYQSGKSIRQLCEQTGYSIGRMRRLLEAGGVKYRGRGTATRKRNP